MNLDLQFYWGLIVKRLPVMTALFLVCVVTATVSALKLPPTYSTSARLLMEDPQISDDIVRSVAQGSASQQFQIIRQKLRTRANMLDIARKYNVFEDIQSMSAEDIVDEMRRQTSIRESQGRLLTVSFRSRSGRISADVVNEYVTLILQESSDIRMAQAESTLGFFEQEVERLGEDLDLQSARIVTFKNQHASALPGDLSYRKDRQSTLQERQARLETEISDLQKQSGELVAIFEQTGRVPSENDGLRSRDEKQLARFYSDIEQALLVYSETNPKVVLLRNRIAQLEKKIAADKQAALSDPEAPAPATLLDITLADISQRIVNKQEQLERTNERLAELEGSIQATAGNAIALNALERDFTNIQDRYNDAVKNLDRSRVSERIELSARGQRITVIENANVPLKPSGPKRFNIIAKGVLLGGALALGFFVLLELLNRTIRRPFELQSRFGIVPLAVIPYMESRRERVMRRSVLLGAFLAVLIGVPAALWYIDTAYMPLDILANKVIDRLGIS